MKSLNYKTKSANRDTVNKKWYVVDAKDQVLGRLSSKIAFVLKGKHKPDYTPHVDCGDNVIVLNADKFILTGNKAEDKEYVKHSGYPGGQKFVSLQATLKRFPDRPIEKAIKGMLPKNKLGRKIFNNLYVYTGTEHPHKAQNPEVLDLNSIK